MPSSFKISRRGLITGAAVAGSGALLSGCDAFDSVADRSSGLRGFLEGAGNGLSYRIQRALIGNHSMAQEFSESEIRQPMRPNGVTRPDDQTYLGLAANGFADYRLQIAGLVEKPASFSLSELMAMPARTQVTRHDCVEGWSCIARWTGVPLGHVLDQAGVKREARYAVFYCLDTIERGLSGEVKYYESIDLVDARHPQTILAYGMNGQRLPVENGAPLRLRVERQLGYKMAKYVGRIELVDALSPIALGKGGYWEDRGYEWYAGI
ncbi:MAG: molybdopterin-binding protein [Rhizobiales bacterium]|nr:molybdopterin-binding protein [Hyphomicrobiales bacterium]